MISLTPIDERIQKRLFQKMELLGNKREIPNVSAEERISPQQIYNKTTFIRMSSILKTNSITLMAGELDEDGSVLSGYDDIYGSRGDTDNKFKRPMPGVKSIDAEFKGGQKALREATISWTCWSYDDIIRLTPHFLTPGAQVLLEWGWVYDENTLKKLPILKDLVGDGDIKDSVYRDYQDTVLKNNGDFDFMAGIVKDYEYTTRDDGAFDCTTTISSVGTSIFSTPQPNKQTENTSILLKRRELRRVTRTETSAEDVISFDVGATFKFFMKDLLNYIKSDIKNQKNIKKIVVRKKEDEDFSEATDDEVSRVTSDIYYVRKNAYIFADFNYGTTAIEELTSNNQDAWIRWGWFEDNILSKFISYVSKNKQGKEPITSHRSVEKIIRGDEAEFESVRIRNHKDLETVNIQRYILPGKFKTFDPQKSDIRTLPYDERTLFENKILFKNGSNDREVGDSQSIVELAKIVNEKDNFSPFNTDKEEEGYFRNILIPFSVLLRCFSNSDDTSDFTAESFNLAESFDNLFRELNSDLPIWSYELTADEEDSRRTKIIDTSITAVDFSKIKKVDSESENKKGTKSVYNSATNEVVNNGVFFFPVWRADSIVKSQNVTVSIPDSLKLTALYGNTYSPEETNNNPEPEFIDIPTIILGKITAEELGKMDDISLAQASTIYDLFGADEESELNNITQPLLAKGGKDNVRNYISNNIDRIKQTYVDKLQKINNQINSGITPDDKSTTNLDPSITYPTPDLFFKEYPENFVVEFTRPDKSKKKNMTNIYSQKFNPNGRMKEQFIDYVSDKISLTSNSRQTQIIPFDLELDIDGIGGILPFNSFHSSYLPKKYQELTIFQIFGVGHKVDSSGWTVSISGKMRTTLDKAALNSENKDGVFNLKSELTKILDETPVSLQKEIENVRKGELKPFELNNEFNTAPINIPVNFETDNTRTR